MAVCNQNAKIIMTNKLLFLDIDGVLNSTDYYFRRGYITETKSIFGRDGDDLDPDAVDILKGFVIEYNINIVISSTWRKLFSIKELKELFLLAGWEGIPIIDVTPVIHNAIRGEEIQYWLDNIFTGKCDNYIILDDDSDFTPTQLNENFVHVSNVTGLQPLHIEQMKERLGKT